MQLLMSNVQNKIALYVNFKKRIHDYTNYFYRGIPLHLQQNNLTYHSTGKKYNMENFLIKKRSMKLKERITNVKYIRSDFK